MGLCESRQAPAAVADAPETIPPKETNVAPEEETKTGAPGSAVRTVTFDLSGRPATTDIVEEDGVDVRRSMDEERQERVNEHGTEPRPAPHVTPMKDYIERKESEEAEEAEREEAEKRASAKSVWMPSIFSARKGEPAQRSSYFGSFFGGKDPKNHPSRGGQSKEAPSPSLVGMCFTSTEKIDEAPLQEETKEEVDLQESEAASVEVEQH